MRNSSWDPNERVRFCPHYLRAELHTHSSAENEVELIERMFVQGIGRGTWWYPTLNDRATLQMRHEFRLVSAGFRGKFVEPAYGSHQNTPSPIRD
jgi:hypothetical protein